ncbi:hypothetical protein ANN_17980 [Periplaneta americana]|uniref:Histone-lysine N-methyltransferase SETMAR n=1 Tax=Periplaneta americana TaxID=6978 RepID=A0ABQ8SNQ9_PERAM|nr:hypothetical protein ANN_17980 [Periplaneta americana]
MHHEATVARDVQRGMTVHRENIIIIIGYEHRPESCTERNEVQQQQRNVKTIAVCHQNPIPNDDDKDDYDDYDDDNEDDEDDYDGKPGEYTDDDSVQYQSQSDYGLSQEYVKQASQGQRMKVVTENNAPSHKSLVAIAAISTEGFELLQHPPYSPHLTPRDFRLFSKLKEHLRGKKFSCNNEVMQSVNQWSAEGRQAFFQEAIEMFEHC